MYSWHRCCAGRHADWLSLSTCIWILGMDLAQETYPHRQFLFRFEKINVNKSKYAHLYLVLCSLEGLYFLLLFSWVKSPHVGILKLSRYQSFVLFKKSFLTVFLVPVVLTTLKSSVHLDLLIVYSVRGCFLLFKCE